LRAFRKPKAVHLQFLLRSVSTCIAELASLKHTPRKTLKIPLYFQSARLRPCGSRHGAEAIRLCLAERHESRSSLRWFDFKRQSTIGMAQRGTERSHCPQSSVACARSHRISG